MSRVGNIFLKIQIKNCPPHVITILSVKLERESEENLCKQISYEYSCNEKAKLLTVQNMNENAG